MMEFPFSLEWPIPESELLPFKDDDSNEDYLEKNFSSKIPGCSCYFEFYPHGFEEERRGQTWILFNINIENVKKIVADYTLTIESANYSKKIHDMIRFGHWFFIADKKDFFDSKNKFIVNGKCNVKVEGTFKFECNASFACSVIAAAAADKKFEAEMPSGLPENPSSVDAKAVEKAERFSTSSLESDLPDLRSTTPSANDLQKAQNPSSFDPFIEAINETARSSTSTAESDFPVITSPTIQSDETVVAVELQKAQNPSHLDHFIEALSEKSSTFFGESDLPELTQTVVVANDLQRTEIQSHLDSFIEVTNETERSSTSSTESDLPVITSPTIQSDEKFLAVEFQKVRNPSSFDPFIEAVSEKSSTSSAQSDLPAHTFDVANDLQRTEIQSHLDSFIEVTNEAERSTCSTESDLPVITSPTIQSEEIAVAIELRKTENLYKPIKYFTPAEAFLKECCKQLGLKFMSKKCLRLLSNIKISSITPNSKPAAIFSTNDKSGFGCFSLFFTGTEKNTVVIRRKVREKMMDDLVKFDEEKLKTIMSSVITTKDLEAIVRWFKCRIMVYCNETWKKYGDWNFGDEFCVPLFVLEKKEFNGKFVYQIVLTVKED